MNSKENRIGQKEKDNFSPVWKVIWKICVDELNQHTPQKKPSFSLILQGANLPHVKAKQINLLWDCQKTGLGRRNKNKE